MRLLFFPLIFPLILIPRISCQEELLQNPDFEEEFGEDNWFCYSCSMEHSTDAYTGSYSGSVTGRGDNWRNPSYWLTDIVEQGLSYFFSAWIKLTTQPNELFESVSCLVRIAYDSGSDDYVGFAVDPMVRAADGWQRVGGDFGIPTPPDRDIVSIRLYIQPDPNVEFLIDTSSLKEISPYDEGWRQAADERIREIRMSDLSIRLTIDDSINPEDIEVHVNMTEHGFQFGSAVQWWLIHGVSDTDKRYQDFIYSNLNWATLETALKWGNMEEERGNINYQNAERALVKLEANGIRTRGHTIFWGKPGYDPEWLEPLNAEELKAEVDRRLEGVVDHFRGRLPEWDVNNEVLHGQFYEEGTGEWDITDHMFQKAKDLDPDTKLFLNDYGMLTYGQVAVAMESHARKMLARNTPLDAIGLQSHLVSVPDIAAMEKRLDTVAEAGLPLVVTELSYVQPDVTIRGQVYEDVMRLYFSHSAMEGILLWGFWDQATYKPNSSLVDGEFLEPNEAGERYLHLLNTEWQTHVLLPVSSPSEEHVVRAFHGNYNVTVWEREGRLLQSHNVPVIKGGDNSIDIEVVEI